MTRLKYVRLAEYDSIIIFPEIIQHNSFEGRNPISAGFCNIDCENRKVNCFGESFSLGLSSLPDDSEIATWQFFREDY